MEAFMLLLLGFGAGSYGVLVGAGGGFILAPALIIFFDMEPTVVAGTSLALVAINALSGWQVYKRMGLVDYRSGLLFAAAAIPGAVLAPFILTTVADGIFRLLLGSLLLGLAVLMMMRPRAEQAPRKRGSTDSPRRMVRSRRILVLGGGAYEYRFNEALAASFNVSLGFMSSFFGTGGGFLRTPILVYSFNFPVLVAVATSVFTIIFYTTAGAITHASLGHVDWYPTFVWAGIGLVAGAQVGARLAGKIGSVWVLRLLLVLVLGLGLTLVIQGISG